MDASIADILASVTRDHHATFGTVDKEAKASRQQLDLQLLTRAWISERVTPELLPYPTELMERVMQRIREQIETIEDRTSRMDAGTSFTLVIIQTELERYKFLVRSFLRSRIAKIDAHPQHILAVSTSTTLEEEPLLSATELAYLRNHLALLTHHYSTSFLSSFPPKLRRLDDRAGAGGVAMVDGPDLDKAVWVRCMGIPRPEGSKQRRGRAYDAEADLFDNERVVVDDEEEERLRRREDSDAFGPVEVSCGFVPAGGEADEDAEMGEASQAYGSTQRSRQSVGAGGGSGGERVVNMRRGEVWLVRWSSIRDAVTRGECELI